MKRATALKKPFGRGTFARMAHARYLGWEDTVEVEFDDGLCYVEPHANIKRANKVSKSAVPVRVSVPRRHRTHFRIEYDTGEVADVSWEFMRELPPSRSPRRAKQNR